MTSLVTVEAHCSENKEVHIFKSDGQGHDTITTLNDGERWSEYVYGEYQITVAEIDKKN